MSEERESDGIDCPSQKIKLVLKTSNNEPAVSSNPASEIGSAAKESSSSPPRPSYSPVTPPLTNAVLHEREAAGETQWIEEPEALPVSLEENADAIALRATISLLQMQRERSLKDIRNLDKMKQLALDHPKEFVDDLQAGNLRKPGSDSILLHEVDESDEADSVDQLLDSHRGPRLTKHSKFGYLPDAQNVARCPPIEWSKYHIVGEPLDQIHEMQKQHPGASLTDLTRGAPLPNSEIAAPYRPFKDTLTADKAPSGYGP